MKQTYNLKLQLPQISTDSDWMSVINTNFIVLDTNIGSLFHSIKQLTETMNSGVFYYKEYEKDGKVYNFVYITEKTIGDNIIYELTYYADVKYKTNEDGTVTNTIIGDGDKATIPVTAPYEAQLGCGAYVLNEHITTVVNGKHTSWKQGDILVITKQLSGTSFDKYPDIGFYIEPRVIFEDNTTKISYKKQTYPQLRVRQNSEYAGSVPAFHFVRTSLSSKVSMTFNDTEAQSIDDVGCFVKFYYINGTTRCQTFFNYNAQITEQNSTFTVTINIDDVPFDTNNYYCVIYAGHSIPGDV